MTSFGAILAVFALGSMSTELISGVAAQTANTPADCYTMYLGGDVNILPEFFFEIFDYGLNMSEIQALCPEVNKAAACLQGFGASNLVPISGFVYICRNTASMQDYVTFSNCLSNNAVTTICTEERCTFTKGTQDCQPPLNSPNFNNCTLLNRLNECWYSALTVMCGNVTSDAGTYANLWFTMTAASMGLTSCKIKSAAGQPPIVVDDPDIPSATLIACAVPNMTPAQLGQLPSFKNIFEGGVPAAVLTNLCPGVTKTLSCLVAQNPQNADLLAFVNHGCNDNGYSALESCVTKYAVDMVLGTDHLIYQAGGTQACGAGAPTTPTATCTYYNYKCNSWYALLIEYCDVAAALYVPLWFNQTASNQGLPCRFNPNSTNSMFMIGQSTTG